MRGLRVSVLLGAALFVALSAGAVPVLGSEDGLQSVSGSITFHFLDNDAVRFSVKGDEDGDPTDDYATFTIAPDSHVGPAGPDGVRTSGTIGLTGALILDHPAGQTVLIDPVLRLLDGASLAAPLACLGLTRAAHPRHPLYALGNITPDTGSVRLIREVR